VNRLVGDEHGSVLVVVAAALPVLFLLLALVFDAGNWFTHSRQLHNRADAAAQAAGVEFGRQWARCTLGTTGLGNQRDQADDAIVAAAKGYAGGEYNAEVADVKPEDIVVNDGNENLCDPLVPAVEVDVTETDIGSLFASFGLPLGQTSAAARMELLRTASETGFAPLAIEDQRIVKAQARFSNGCDPSDSLGAAPVNLAPLASQTMPGMTLWGGPVNLTLPNAGPAGFASTCPSSNFDYEPVTVEVRLTSREEVDLDALTCAQLQAVPFADCFRDVTQVRAFACQPNIAVCAGRDDDGAGETGDRPLVFDVAFSGPTCSPDPYYARLGPGQSDCTFGASIEMDWSDRPVDNTIAPEENFDAKLVVDGEVSELETAGPELRTLTTATPLTLGSVGPSNVEIQWRWKSTVGNFNGVNCVTNPDDCDQSGTIVVQRTNLADNPTADTSPSDIVQLARFSTNASPDPTSQIDSVPATGGGVNVHFVVGLRSELKSGQFALLRNRFRDDRVLLCDPAFTASDTETMIAEGCAPPFAANPLTSGFWWSGGSCPMPTWFAAPYTNTPWRCLRTLPHGANAAAVANGLATRTGNEATCTNPDHYLDYYGTKSSPIDSTDPRFVSAYVIPFGGLKGSPDGTVPILDIATFYVTDWGAPGGAPDDPCEPDVPLDDETTIPGRVAGYFVSTVGPNTGPVEPDQPCDPTILRPCRAVLVR
jgi:hypothetical protein